MLTVLVVEKAIESSKFTIDREIFVVDCLLSCMYLCRKDSRSVAQSMTLRTRTWRPIWM